MQFLFVLGLLSVATQCSVIPPTTLSPADMALVDVYGNFTTGIAKALVDNDLAMNTGPHGGDDGGMCQQPIQVHSGFGLGHILAIVNEHLWKVGTPVFQDLLAKTPSTLSDAFELIFKKLLQSPDITFSSAIFTADDLPMTPALTKLKVQVQNTDLTQSNSAIAAVNSYITKFLGQSLDQPYIPKDVTISSAAKAILVDTLRVTETWGTVATKVAAMKFNGGDTVDMIEMKGAFQVMENENAVEVIVPFQNNLRALSFVLPKNIAKALNGNLGEPQIANYSSVRIQIPSFKATVRNYEADLTNQCNFNKEVNFVQPLDHLVQITLNDQTFDAISVTGAQINDVAKFKATPSTATLTPVPCSNTASLPTIPAPMAPSGSTDTEKVIVFDRTFSWTLLDRDLGPIIAGTVVSPKIPPATITAASFVFGLEMPLGYAKCL